MDYDVDDTQRALRQDESISSPSSNGHQTQRDASRTQKSHVDSPDLQRLQIRDERSSDSARRPSGRRRSDDHDRPEPPAKDPQSQRLGRKRASTVRTCGKCNGTLTGQFVRALENTYHLECFTCQDCGKIVASKFFPVPEQPPHLYPLCETDYFKRLDLLCHACGGALRGSYITALDRKYHIEHFTCSVCPTIFGAQDSYYEHDGQVYCHYHYSTRFAQRCNGCQTAILKQFVEIFRNGKNQHWHPECYMIHKYWNVRLHSTGQMLPEHTNLEGDANDVERRQVRSDEERVEGKVLWIWKTLSAYEEKSASCISDMLLHVSNGAYVDGVMSAKRFIIHVDLLFTAADDLDHLMTLKTNKGLSYSREAKLLCKKVVAFFQLLAESQGTGVRRLGVTQELLSLVTGLAHYLKLLIRICLQGSLRLERELSSEQGLHQFLDEINKLEPRLEADDVTEPGDLSNYVNVTADTCPICSREVEDRCYRHGEHVVHTGCMECEICHRDLKSDLDGARWDSNGQRLLCRDCTSDYSGIERGFTLVTRLRQYVHLLRVAHARILATLRTSGALPHTSDDPNLDQYDSGSGHRASSKGVSLGPPLLARSNTRSKSYAGTSTAAAQPSASISRTTEDVLRLRSSRMDKNLGSISKRARTSRIIDDADLGFMNSTRADTAEDRFHIVHDKDDGGESVPHLALGNHESIRLDDIPRIVAAEQAKDQRPNATKYARGGLVGAEPKPKFFTSHRRETSKAQDLDKLGPEGLRPKKYFSELSALEYFIVRHVAVLSMEPLLEGHFNQEELLDLIETRKPTFWDRFGKAFKNDKTKGGRKKGVFGVSLEQLVEKDGAESTDGVGPGALRVPALIQDAISAMRTMDMSMEGVFRKNGNIRRLKEMAESIDAKGGDAVDLNAESPVQVAALLKRFLRELPDPVMTYKLHRLFVTSQKITDEDQRRRVLHLSCCLLPKTHRDTMEVLFCFLNWTASFSVVDEESGSKMDVHNLATVIAPNILISNGKTDGMEDSFLAIEAVKSLIEHNDAMCVVPEDLQSILNDSSLFSSSADITTKGILKRYADIGRPTAGGAVGADSLFPDDPSDVDAATTSHAGEKRGSAPVITRVAEDDRASAWHAETSARSIMRTADLATSPSAPMPGGSQQQTPPIAQTHNGFYGAGGAADGSKDSFAMDGSPSRLGSGAGKGEQSHNGHVGIT